MGLEILTVKHRNRMKELFFLNHFIWKIPQTCPSGKLLRDVCRGDDSTGGLGVHSPNAPLPAKSAKQPGVPCRDGVLDPSSGCDGSIPRHLRHPNLGLLEGISGCDTQKIQTS